MTLRRRLPDRPAWVMPGAFADFDFRNKRSFGAPVTWLSAGTINAGQSAVQQGSGLTACYLAGSDGVFRLKAANSIKIADGIGLACFDNSVYYALQNRDLTQAVWTKVGCTAARTTGADGLSNTGSLLTATTPSATCAQAITLVSTTLLLSAVIKRVTGSGAVSISMDGGVTSTALSLTTAYQQLAAPQQTVVNPQVVIHLATSGDAVAIDFVDLEGGGNACPIVPSPPVAVTTAAVTRFREIPEINNGRGGGGYPNGALGERWLNAINSGQAAMYVEFTGNPATVSGGPVTTDGIQPFSAAIPGSSLGIVGSAFTSNVVLTGWNKAMSGFASSATAGGGGAIIRGCLNGGPLVSTTGTAGAATTTHMVLGGNGSGANALNGYIARIALFDHLPPDSLFVEATRLLA